MNLFVVLVLSAACVIGPIAFFCLYHKKIFHKSLVIKKKESMFRKTKNFFIKFFCIIWISAMWSISAASYAEGGAEISGFFAFVLWIISLTILLKVNAIASAIGSSILILVLRITKFGFQDVILYGLGIVAAMFGGLILLSKLMWGEIGGRGSMNQGNIQETEEKCKKSKIQKQKPQGWGYGYDVDVDEDEVEVQDSEVDKEFYNIKDKYSSADCPHIYHKSSVGGQEPFYCELRDCQISFDYYYHLCAYGWKSEEQCPYRARECSRWGRE